MSALLRTTMAIALGAAVACAPSAPAGERTEETSGRLEATLDLLSPATCTLQNARLASCAVRAATVTPVPFEAAVPVRTRLVPQVSGDCFTQYPMGVTASADGADDVTFDYLRQPGGTIVRRRDRAAVTSINVRDGSTWTSRAFFDQGCRAALKVIANEPDVDSRAEADAIIAAIEADLAAKIRVRDDYRRLTLYARAHTFLRSVAEGFRVELTSESITELRSGATGAIDSIAKLAGACDATMNDVDRQNIMLLFMSLPQLGAADAYRWPDGGKKTLEDLIGPQAASVLATIDRLAPSGGSGSTDDEAAYTRAAQAVVLAEAKLAMARAQLASLLGGQR